MINFSLQAYYSREVKFYSIFLRFNAYNYHGDTFRNWLHALKKTADG
ncbi:hypothetical protein [uncultured Prochlorococcus sp.]|nr:hypothetical protein [uncultured Prochlorococcus sp.]